VTPRLTVLLEGTPVYLYSFCQGSYEDKHRYLYAHPESMSPEEVHRRVRDATDLLPEEIDFDYMAEPMGPDLFEQALSMAGFIPVDGDVLSGIWARESIVFTERRYLQECLDRKIKPQKK
jgi:hypothetical protein